MIATTRKYHPRKTSSINIQNMISIMRTGENKDHKNNTRTKHPQRSSLLRRPLIIRPTYAEGIDTPKQANYYTVYVGG